MKLDIDFTNLENLVKNMGASSVDWVSNVTVTHVETDWKIDLETKGIDVGIDDIEITDNGLLKYRNEQILLYIKEISSFNTNSSLPKYHFYQCSTLNRMQREKRFERYVVTQRKTGYFLMGRKDSYYSNNREIEEKLDVCGNCLSWYNRNYRKRYLVATFDIIEFFEHFTKSPISQKPLKTDTFTSVSNYARGVKNDYSESILDNSSRLQQSYLQSEISSIPKNEFNSPIKSIPESYVDISPVVTQTTVLELDIDENTQNFEDMF